MESYLKSLLFSVIRSGIEISDLSYPISDEDVNSLFEIAKAQSILPLFLRGIKRASVQTIKIPSEYEKVYLKDTYRSVQFEETLKQIKSVFNEFDIPFMLLKGAVLRDLYPDAFTRTSCDLDILVHESDLNKAVSAIESKVGFKEHARGYHDIAMINSRFRLELHFSLKENMEKIDCLLADVWNYAIPVDNSCQYEMSTEYLIFHVLAHMSFHMTHGGIGIRPLIDLWLLNNKTSYDKNKLMKILSDTGLNIFYDKATRLVDSWMSDKAIDVDLIEFENYCLSSGVFGDKKNAALSQVRNKSKAKYIFNRLFVQRSYLEELYPALKNKPYLLPLYQIKRWIRLSDSKRMKKAHNELEVAINATQEEKENVDLLLKSLGF